MAGFKLRETDERASENGKKKLDDAIDGLVKNGRTSHPFILGVNMARIINDLCDGSVIAPWDVNQLSDDELNVFRALNTDLPERKAYEQKKEQVFEDVRKKHPNYRKYLA